MVFPLDTAQILREVHNRLPTGTVVNCIQLGAAVQNCEVCLVFLCERKSLRAKPTLASALPSVCGVNQLVHPAVPTHHRKHCSSVAANMPMMHQDGGNQRLPLEKGHTKPQTRGGQMKWARLLSLCPCFHVNKPLGLTELGLCWPVCDSCFLLLQVCMAPTFS